MTAPRDAATQAALDKLLETHGLGPATLLYREAMRSALTPTGAPGLFRLAANPSPSESVIDVYGQGYLVQAEQVGPGLAFAESDSPNWQETMEMRALKAAADQRAAMAVEQIEVEVALLDILQQGGLIYPVESVTVERAWYCTLPAGTVTVREVR
ncbi:MAG TPA: hypothetical protein VF981_05030 [Gemmatimonadaceae bacterium]